MCATTSHSVNASTVSHQRAGHGSNVQPIHSTGIALSIELRAPGWLRGVGTTSGPLEVNRSGTYNSVTRKVSVGTCWRLVQERVEFQASVRAQPVGNLVEPVPSIIGRWIDFGEGLGALVQDSVLLQSRPSRRSVLLVEGSYSKWELWPALTSDEMRPAVPRRAVLRRTRRRHVHLTIWSSRLPSAACTDLRPVELVTMGGSPARASASILTPLQAFEPATRVAVKATLSPCPRSEEGSPGGATPPLAPLRAIRPQRNAQLSPFRQKATLCPRMQMV